MTQLERDGVLLVEDGNHGEYRPRPGEFSERGTSFIRAADMNNGRVLFDRASRINEEALCRIRKGVGAPGDVVLSHKGTVGKVSLAPLDCEPFVCSPQTTFWRSLDEGQIDRRYLYFYLCSSEFQDQLRAREGETDMAAYVSLTVQRTLNVLLPPIKQQRSIAHILGTLDDKIELNRRMNETLEAMVRGIFESWFVDFEPVRAKLEGSQPPGLGPDLATLFPDSFEDSELGPVPKGWRAGTVSDIGSIVRSSVRPGELDGHTPYIGLEHMPRGSISLGDWGSASIVSSGKSSFRAGDILFGKLRPYFHKVGVAQVDGVCSTDVLVLRPIEADHLGVLLGAVSSKAFIDYVDAASTGTKMPRTNWRDMGRYPIVVPDRKTSAAFSEQFVAPFLQQIGANIHESRTLATLRDAILPRLMSGKLSV